MDLRINYPTSCFNKFFWNLISTGDLCLFSLSTVISTSEVVGTGTNGSAVCMSAHFHSVTERMIPPPSQNPVAVCNQITLLILYCISSRMLTLLKITDAPIQNSDILVLTVRFTFINFSSFRYSLFTLLNCLLASCLIFLTLCIFLQFWSCTHCFLASSFDLKNLKILIKPWNMLLPFIQTWTLLAKIWIFSVIFSQSIFMSLLSFTFSKVANLSDFNLILFSNFQLT